MTHDPVYPLGQHTRKSSCRSRLIYVRRERKTLQYQRNPPTFPPEHPSGYHFPTCYE